MFRRYTLALLLLTSSYFSCVTLQANQKHREDAINLIEQARPKSLIVENKFAGEEGLSVFSEEELIEELDSIINE